MFRAQEGAEDDAGAGARVLEERGVGPGDVVMGIAAGGTTPFVWGALRRAREIGAGTVFLSCVPTVPGQPAVDVAIHCVTGPEIVTGSTRLKAGTATKLILNTISTLTMVALGKTYGNRMVDLKASNAKLVDRARRLVRDLAEVSEERAAELLDQAGGRVKVAVAMAWLGVDAARAEAALGAAGGRLAGVRGSVGGAGR
jgi:N-acetylmuramic acid 6-phosphate etherase